MRQPLTYGRSDALVVTTRVVGARPGAVLLAESPFFPGGGGQLPDRGVLRWESGEAEVIDFEPAEDGLWHVLAAGVEPSGAVQAEVDAAFRGLMSELHTATHVLNAHVFLAFDGALVTGAQMLSDGTARMDFDLPDTDPERLRGLEAALNDTIAQDLAIEQDHVPVELARAQRGLIRNRSVAPPPTPDGLIRVIEIVGLDRQACGGTHLTSTGGLRPIRVLRVDNKGRHNRRVRIGLAGAPGSPA